MRIRGLDELQYNSDIIAQRTISKFCPKAFSPSLAVAKEEQQAFMMVRQNGWPDFSCGAWYGEGFQASEDDCMQKARQRNMLSFSFGRGYSAGYCYSEATHVTQEAWDNWKNNRTNPS